MKQALYVQQTFSSKSYDFQDIKQREQMHPNYYAMHIFLNLFTTSYQRSHLQELRKLMKNSEELVSSQYSN
jgi:hypothetical protein